MKILSSASARPNFVKLAAVHHALKGRTGVTHVIVHTGQHYDPLLSDIFFKQLEIGEPAYNLGVKGAATRKETIEATMQAFLPVLEKEKPDIVLVYGDVNGAVGAARAAKKLRIRIGHVEAGLRSGDLDMPEEHNRIEIDQIADLLFTTEQSAEKNIKKEQLKGAVHFVGNTMIDTLMKMQPQIQKSALPIEARCQKAYAVATLHRPSNVDQKESLDHCMNLLLAVAKIQPVHLPIHPRLKFALEKFGYLHHSGKLKNIIQHPSMGYLPFLHLVEQANFIITDSGGIQEEAAFLKKRCFTMRRNTERPVTIDCGSNRLIDPMNERDRSEVLEFAKNPQKVSVNDVPLWDGKAGERIVNILLSL